MKNRVFKIALSFLVVLLVISFRSTGYKIGDTATDFSLKNVDGNMVSLKSFKNAKGFIVIFTCNTCPFSKLYEQRIIDLNTKYAPLGFPVVAINPNDPVRQPGDSFDKMKQLAKEKNYSFPYLVDETQKITSTYGATRTPHVFVLDKKGDILKVAYIGAIDDNHRNSDDANNRYVEQAVDQLIIGGKIKTTETKALGCTIKWKEA